MYGADRRRLREVFFRAWERYRAGLPLEGVEATIVAVAREHPEYHALLENPAGFEDHDFAPESGRENPFLHMAMHLTVEEQLSGDRPAGIRALHRLIRARTADEHAARHAMMECLGETLWQAQRDGALPDEDRYLDCLGRRGGTAGFGPHREKNR